MQADNATDAQIRSITTDQLHRGLPVGGFDDLEPVGQQVPAQHGPDIRLVVNDQNLPA